MWNHGNKQTKTLLAESLGHNYSAASTLSTLLFFSPSFSPVFISPATERCSNKVWVSHCSWCCDEPLCLVHLYITLLVSKVKYPFLFIVIESNEHKLNISSNKPKTTGQIVFLTRFTQTGGNLTFVCDYFRRINPYMSLCEYILAAGQCVCLKKYYSVCVKIY